MGGDELTHGSGAFGTFRLGGNQVNEGVEMD